MSSRCWEGRGLTVVVVGCEELEDDAGEAAFEAAQGFGLGFALGQFLLVVGPSQGAGHPGLGDRDAVDRGVEVTIA